MSNIHIEPKLAHSEASLIEKISEISTAAGSHSPSLATTLQAIPELNLEIDACFLSNPYATNLVIDYFESELTSDNDLFRRAIEAYPSQNRAIADPLATALGLDPERLFVANGATEAIQAIVQKFASHVHIAIPTFSPYYEFAGDQIPVTKFQLSLDEDFALDPEAYVQSVKSSGADVAVLITPNNPDGRNIGQSDLRWILEELRHLEAVVVDESFIHFARSAPRVNGLPTLAPIVEQFENAILVKSMAKDFGVAGLRAGYAVMEPKRVSGLLDSGYLWNTNGFSEFFYSLFSREDFVNEYKSTLSRYLGVIDRFTSSSASIEALKTVPTEANFQLVQLPEGVSADLVTSLLLIRHGIYVRSCSDKIGLNGEYIRVAIRTDRENKLVLDALESIVNEVLG